ncbi:MAG: hypothetical protein COA57_01810 [Flavobacteriales bacterium]|nr:MAG: hypothetical protein COA57_01810 [Flavobacteriales bacterium]
MNNMLKYSILAFILIAFGCRKSDRDNDVTTHTSWDYALADVLFNDVFEQVHYLVMLDSLKSKPETFASMDDCIDTFIVSSSVYPITLTIDYGTGSSCDDGRTRKGKISAKFTGSYFQENTVVTITLINFYIDDYKVDGKKTLTVTSVAGGDYTYFEKDENGLISNSDTRIVWEITKTREWSTGTSSADVDDDVFIITSGNGSGTTTKGNTFTGSILSGMKVEYDCNWISSGQVTVQPSNLSPRTLDCGSACGASATVTINGETYDLTIP